MIAQLFLKTTFFLFNMIQDRPKEAALSILNFVIDTVIGERVMPSVFRWLPIPQNTLTKVVCNVLIIAVKMVLHLSLQQAGIQLQEDPILDSRKEAYILILYFAIQQVIRMMVTPFKFQRPPIQQDEEVNSRALISIVRTVLSLFFWLIGIRMNHLVLQDLTTWLFRLTASFRQNTDPPQEIVIV